MNSQNLTIIAEKITSVVDSFGKIQIEVEGVDALALLGQLLELMPDEEIRKVTIGD